MFSRLITTVSPRYAEEIQTPEYGFGFDGILRERGRPAGRHSERDRLRSVEPRAATRICPCPFDAETCRERRPPSGAPSKSFGIPANEATMAPAAGRHGVAAGGPEGVRSAGGRVPKSCSALDAIVRAARDRRPRATRTCGADLARRLPRPRRRAHRVRRRAGAPDRRRRGHVPDAVAVRAVRAEPDVQPALRHGAAGARHRGAGRHGARTSTPRRARAPGSPSTSTRRRRCSARCGGRWSIYRQRDVWRAVAAGGHAQDHSWDSSARAYVSGVRARAGAAAGTRLGRQAKAVQRVNATGRRPARWHPTK